MSEASEKYTQTNWTTDYSCAYIIGMDVRRLLRDLLTETKQGELAENLGVTQATVSRWLSKSEPRGDNRDKIVALARRKGLMPAAPIITPAEPSQFVAVPMVSWVSAGKMADASTQVPERDAPKLAFADLGAGDFFALRVSGDSMDRISPEGSIIVVDRRDRSLTPGKPYVFALRGEATYKLWRAKPPRLEPFSTNPMNEPIFLDRRGEIEVVGRVRRSVLDL